MVGMIASTRAEGLLRRAVAHPDARPQMPCTLNDALDYIGNRLCKFFKSPSSTSWLCKLEQTTIMSDSAQQESAAKGAKTVRTWIYNGFPQPGAGG
jgi:hypothetical protein